MGHVPRFNEKNHENKMKKEELLNLISQGESETVEFKQSFNKVVITAIVAFSNTKGGKVIIGDDNGKNSR